MRNQKVQKAHFAKTIAMLLTIVMLLSIIPFSSIFVSADTEPEYVWIVREYNLTESEFTAAAENTTLNFNFTANLGTNALAEMGIGAMEVYCDGTKIETNNINKTIAKGASGQNEFATTGTASIAKGNHTITVKFQVYVTDIDASWEAEANSIYFFLWGSGLTEGAHWVIVADNMIPVSELKTGTPVEPPKPDSIWVAREYNLTESEFTTAATNTTLNFNFTANFGGTAKANLKISKLVLWVDGVAVELVTLDTEFVKGETTDGAFTASFKTQIAKGNHTIKLAFYVEDISDVDSAWASEANSIYYFLWGNGLTEGAHWVIVADNMIPVSELSTGTTGYVDPELEEPEEPEESSEYVWVNRFYELPEAAFKADYSYLFFRMWFQNYSTTIAMDIYVKEIQIWVDDEMLESHKGTGFSSINVEGEDLSKPVVVRSDGESSIYIAKNSTSNYDQLQFYTDGYNPIEKDSHTLVFRVLLKIENPTKDWKNIVTNTSNAYADNVLVANFWGEGLNGEYWLTAWDNGTIIGYQEVKQGSTGSFDYCVHDYGTPTYTWNGNQCTATRVCSNNATHVDTETVTATYVKDTDATCTTNEFGHYEATFEGSAFAKQSTESNGIEVANSALNHDYGTPTYAWNNNSCTATRVCSHDASHIETETVTATYVKDTDATCTTNEFGHYEATFEGSAFAKQSTESNSFEVANSALNHAYGTPSYTWNGNQCTATRVCSNNATHVETETVTGIYVKDTAATSNANEFGHYEATFTNSAFAKQATAANSYEVPNTMGHDYQFNRIEWTNNTAKAIYVCSHDASHVVEYDCAITSEVTLAATCAAKGTTTYTATYDGHTATKTEDIAIDSNNHDLVHHDAKAETCTEIGWNAYDTCSRCDYTTYVEIPAKNHSFGTPTYTWNGAQCTATRVCSHDASHVETETVTATYVKDTDATETSNEFGHYEATFTNSAFTKQATTNNSVEKEGTMIPPKSSKGCNGTVGAIGLVVVTSILGMCWKKKEN